VEEGPRGRSTYAVTDAGRAELRRWMRDPPEQFNVRNEFVLRLFLLSALEPDEARAALQGLLAQNDAALTDLHEQVDKFDALAEPGASPPLNRMVAEFGLRSFETLRDWALWALDHLGEATPPSASNEPSNSPNGPAKAPDTLRLRHHCHGPLVASRQLARVRHLAVSQLLSRELHDGLPGKS